MSTPFDPFGGVGVQDPNRLLQELARRVSALEEAVRSRPGMTEASKGWVMRGMAAPDMSGEPATDGWVGIKGGRLTFQPGGGGSEVQLEPYPVAGDPGDVTTPDAGTEYTTLVQNLINDLKSRLNALLFALRQAGIIA